MTRGANYSAGAGAFFSSSREAAESFAGEGGKLYEVFLNIRNPKIVNWDFNLWSDATYVQSAHEELGEAGIENTDDVSRFAREKGNDGTIIEHVKDDTNGNNEAATVFTIFSPNQIKSVDNQGTFNNKEGDIYLMAEEENKNAPLGSFQATSGGQIINLFKGSNDATIIHEQLGHAYLDILERMQNENGADLTPEFKKKMDDLNKWLGATPNADGKIVYTVEQHEKFANGAMRYVKDGKFGSSKIAELLKDFRRWLADLWAWVKENGLEVEISEEVRAVFDYLLDSETLDVKKISGENLEGAKKTYRKIKEIAATKNLDKSIDKTKADNLVSILEELKKRRVKRPKGAGLQRRLEKFGIKGDSGDVAAIVGENKKIKVYQKGDEGYEKALSIEVFTKNEKNAKNYLQYESQPPMKRCIFATL
jgi:hypothetical protein